jgi:hypothetical protein
MDLMLKAPEKIPPEMVDKFLMVEGVHLEDQYIDQAGEDTQDELISKFYNDKTFDSFLEKAKNKGQSYYGITDSWLYDCLDKFIKPTHKCLIIGSTQPWYEAVLSSYGCKDITVSEYAKRPTFRGIKYIHPDELKDKYDICISISSYEHCGLGRYGDPLDPDGDLKAMKQLKNHMVEKGKLFLAVPIGQDALVWNAHRIYGHRRLPKLIEGWNILGSSGYSPIALDRYMGIDGSYQPVLVLENT